MLNNLLFANNDFNYTVMDKGTHMKEREDDGLVQICDEYDDEDAESDR